MSQRRVLITGAGGFIGSHLVEAAIEEGYKVRAFLRYNSTNRRGWLQEINRPEEIEIVSGDVRDFDSVNSAMKGCQAVFHLAALIGIPYSYVSPLAYIKVNVEGTYNVLQSALLHEVEQVLITSTSETYGTARYIPMNEDHPAVGQSPYAATKIAADQLALSYWRSFGLPVKIVRPFNTFGPRQSARAIIPTVIAQLLAGRTVLDLGNDAPTRDFTFVRDTVAGFLAVAKCGECVGSASNIGTGAEISMAELARRIARLMETEVELKRDPQRIRPRESEVERLCCDSSKLTGQTGWNPRWSLDQGLQETIHWVRAHRSFYEPGEYTV